MLSISLAQLKSDIAPMMKGTSINQVKDFYGTAARASNRMLARIDPEETRRTATLATPFWDNVNDYTLATDYKGMIDIRPTAVRTRQNQPGMSDYSQSTARQFDEHLDPDSFSIRWNSAVRTLRAQRLPSGQVSTMDTFDSATENGTWTTEGDASGFYQEPLNFIQGVGSLGFNLSGSTGAADLVNSTAAVTDMSLLRYEDASFVYFYIPVGYSARFTSFTLRRGSSATAYKEVTVSTKGDGTAFSDGWNFLIFNWNQATTTGSPDDTQNTYRRFGINYSAGTAINGVLIDSWTDALGDLFEMEYYSECLFRTAAGAWIYVPTDDTDLVNVGPASYEILKTEMMVDITKIIRTGSIQMEELNDWRRMLNGDPQTRYVKDPPYHGLYADYLSQFPSSRIITRTNYYSFEV